MFQKNPKKNDYKVRFQNRSFRQQLSRQRNYKRPKKILPQTSWGVFLSKIGLGSWSSRVLTLLVFLFLVYLVYIPNFIFISHITVTGAYGNDSASIEKTINNFLAKKTPWPQKNLLLLSKSALQSYLVKNNPAIWQVKNINKKLPSTLIVEVSPRVEAFRLETETGLFTLSNDGLVDSIISESTTTATSSLASIKVSNAGDLFAGKRIFSQAQMDYFTMLETQLPDITKTPLNYLSLDDLQTPDLWVYTNSGFKVAFDLKSDVSESLNRFKLLFSQIGSQDIPKLYYIDMRFKDRGYICFKNTACSQAVQPVQATSTTSAVGN